MALHIEKDLILFNSTLLCDFIGRSIVSFVCLKDKILFRPEMHLLFKIGISVIILQSNSTDMAVIV